MCTTEIANSSKPLREGEREGGGEGCLTAHGYHFCLPELLATLPGCPPPHFLLEFSYLQTGEPSSVGKEAALSHQPEG